VTISSMKGFLRAGLALATCLGAAVWLAHAPQALQAPQAPQAPRPPVDYNWDVRPILSDYCFRCHGNDEKGRMAGLRLDQSDSAYARRPGQQERYAIVPGRPDDSEVIRRITAPTAARRMPPAVTNKVLTPEQIDILRRWIAEGAHYKPHWAYISPVKPAPPQVKTVARARNEIDRFVLARLERSGLRLSPESDRETLINRVSLTLTGLPPTLADVDAFVADRRPDAYERLVDRLLASPAYGEHMAAYWMDLARWAETDGFLDDHHDRTLWPWRDWVIGAFNRNMRFDQFSTWQLAGDLLPNATREQKLATAFLRVGPRTTENGAIDEEYRIEYVVDRTNTIGTAFLGLTVGCARCHDHKYDVISHKDFYSLSGFFNSADEPGFYAPGHSAVQGGPTLPWPNDEERKNAEAATAKVREREAAYTAARAAATRQARAAVDTVLAKSPAEIASLLRESVGKATVAYYPLDETTPFTDADMPPARARGTPPERLVSLRRNQQQAPPEAAAPDQAQPQGGGARGRGGPPSPPNYVREGLTTSPSGLAGVPPAIISVPTLKVGVKGNALFFDETNKGFLGRDVGWYERNDEFSFDFWLYVDRTYDTPVPVLNHRDDDNSGGAGYRLELENNQLQFYMAHSRPFNMIGLTVTPPMPLKQWTHVAFTYDGSSRASGVKFYLNGSPADVDVHHDNLTQSILPTGYSPLFDNFVGVAFGTRFREKAPVGSALDEIRVFRRALTPLEIRVLHDEGAVAASDRAALARDLLEIALHGDAGVAQAAQALRDAREEHNRILTLVPQVLVMGDSPRPRKTYRLDRGVYSSRAEEVPVRGLVQVYPWNDALPPNRLGLARWLFDPKHPLTARVFVNRMWQMHFGQGIVETAEDFGSQGSIPTHPELLDWLAVTFVESGWDIKRLHKTIVMSAAYRQSSDATDELLKRDPQNRLLTRGPRQRMPAEMVRDSALATSGLLVRTIGGASVRPYQPENIWNPLNSFHRYPAADAIPADEHHRRSVYAFVKRNATHPGMTIFDFPDRNVSTARRRVSNTPLQALELMNDPQFVEVYRALAAQALAAGATDDARLAHVYRLATRRKPGAEQLSILREFHQLQVQRFREAPARATALLETGVTPIPGVDHVRLAALTQVTALVMNSPDAYSIR
jgi:hypothetical protein